MSYHVSFLLTDLINKYWPCSLYSINKARDILAFRQTLLGHRDITLRKGRSRILWDVYDSYRGPPKLLFQPGAQSDTGSGRYRPVYVFTNVSEDFPQSELNRRELKLIHRATFKSTLHEHGVKGHFILHP